MHCSVTSNEQEKKKNNGMIPALALFHVPPASHGSILEADEVDSVTYLCFFFADTFSDSFFFKIYFDVI